MAAFSGVIRSAVLGMDTELHIVLPYDRPAENQQRPPKVLYLLHGLGESSSTWLRETSIERYARSLGLAVVMPEAQRSFYVDMQHGLRWFSYITRELPRLCSEMFHISTKREDTFVAGLSMGGYGALRCALACPGQYAAAASFSGAVDLHEIISERMDDELRREFTAALGSSMRVRAEDDLYLLAEKAARADSPPRILMTCGRQDYLYGMNERMSARFSKMFPSSRFENWDGGHDWDVWDRSIKLALKFFLDNSD